MLPFDPPVRGHLTFERLTFSPSQKGHKELLGGVIFIPINGVVSHLFHPLLLASLYEFEVPPSIVAHGAPSEDAFPDLAKKFERYFGGSWPGKLASGNSNVFWIFTPRLGEMMQFDEHICSIGLVQPSTSQNCGAPPNKCLVYLGYHSPKTNGWKIPQNHGFGILKKPPASNMA